MNKVIYFLGQLGDADVEWLIAHGNRQQVARGTVLIHEGRPAHALYLVLDGTLGVTVSALSEQPVVRLGCGEVVGEMSFVDARPPSATVAALEDAVVLAVPRPALAAKLERDVVFAARFYRAVAQFLSQRLRARQQPTGRGANPPLGEGQEAEDELDANVLDNVHMAGSRFDRVLQRLLGE